MHEDEIIKIPMHSTEAEQAVIGGLLKDPNRFGDVIDIVEDMDFYRPAHQVIFSHIQSAIEVGQTVDIIILADLLSAAGELDEVGGLPYLASVANSTTSTANILVYAQVVKDRSTERKLILASNKIYETAYEADLTTEEKVIQSQSHVLALESSNGEEVAQVNSAIRSVIDQIDQRFSGNEAIGVNTGFEEIDNRTMGFRGSDLIILAGRPAMGKTTYAMNIAAHQAIRVRTPVLVFSMEMSKEQLIERMISAESNIPFNFIRSGKLQESHWPKLTVGVSKIKDSPLYIDDRGALSINQMRSSARKLHKKVGLGLIIIDYIQLAKSKAQSREQEISQISGGLKALAKELDIPVIALSQLSRECEKGQDKRPQCHHLRDSGSIEQDADLIQFLYRDEVYHPDTTHKGITEVITGKFRNGSTGKDYIASRLDVCRFENLTTAIPEQYNEPRRKFKAVN